MFLLLLDRKSDEDEGYAVLKAWKLTWAEFSKVFVLYYIYGRVQAVPTYKVYRLYDAWSSI